MTAPAASVRRQIDGTSGRFVIRTEEGTARLTSSIRPPPPGMTGHGAVPRAMSGRGRVRLRLESPGNAARRSLFRILPRFPRTDAGRAGHPQRAPLLPT
jgi:hypothetical protein